MFPEDGSGCERVGHCCYGNQVNQETELLKKNKNKTRKQKRKKRLLSKSYIKCSFYLILFSPKQRGNSDQIHL